MGNVGLSCLSCGRVFVLESRIVFCFLLFFFCFLIFSFTKVRWTVRSVVFVMYHNFPPLKAVEHNLSASRDMLMLDIVLETVNIILPTEFHLHS